MPYIATEGETLHDNGDWKVIHIKWEREGQCVSMSPPSQFKVVFGANNLSSITVEARSHHSARQAAIEIGELYGSPLKQEDK